MAFFPFFIDISSRKILIVGGGTVALRKAEKLLPFGADITVTAPSIREEFTKIPSVTLLRREFEDSDLDDAFAVIAATNSKELNSHIHRLCTEKNILINTVDNPENCGFYFPALVCENDLVIGISTGGASPVFARYIKEKVRDILDEKTLASGDILARYRPVIKQMFDTEEKRKYVFERLLERCTEGSAPPGENEIKELLESL